MSLYRPFLVAALCSAPLLACGGTESEVIVPQGDHYKFVVSQVQVPTDSTQKDSYGLDLGSMTSSKLDNHVDNALGTLLSLLSSDAVGNFPIQQTIDDAVNQGDLVLLLDLQTADFTSGSATGLTVKLGTPVGRTKA